MKLKKVDTGLLQLALLVSQDFIIKYYQVMLKLPFKPIKSDIKIVWIILSSYNIINEQ